MRRHIEVNQDLEISASYKMISAMDMVFSVISLPIGYLLSTLVHSYLQIPVMILIPLLTFYLFMPSVDVWGKKNYEAYYIILVSDKNVYESV